MRINVRTRTLSGLLCAGLAPGLGGCNLLPGIVDVDNLTDETLIVRTAKADETVNPGERTELLVNCRWALGNSLSRKTGSRASRGRAAGRARVHRLQRQLCN